ncbi:MAG: hypothetical protein P4L31_00120 [Candidatus Babeliales bacterium]|nr:hypothetical protein [Candidatus Babeliales bacterium]
MIYRSMLLSILLLPIASYGKSTEARIKELKEAKFQKELAISNLTELLGNKHKTIANYKSYTANFLTLLLETNPQLKIDGTLDQLINNFKTEFDNTVEFNQLFQKSFLEIEGEISYEALQTWMLIIISERRVIDNLTIQCETCVKELININKELKNLKN